MGRTELPYSLVKRTIGTKTIYYYRLNGWERGKKLSTGKRTKKEALDYVQEVLKDTKLPESGIVFRQIIEPFFDDKSKCPWILSKEGTGQKVMPSTLLVYQFQKKIIMENADFIDKRVVDITENDILKFFTKLSDKKIRTRKLIYSVLCKILREAAKQCSFEYPSSFFDNIRQKGRSKFEKGFFTNDEIDAMFPNFFMDRKKLENVLLTDTKDPFEKSEIYYPFPNYYYKFFFFTLLSTGCRVGEALALKWKDVFPKKKYIEISRNIYRKNKKTIISDTKNHKSRKVPLSVLHKRMFDAYKLISPHTNPDDYIFGDMDGTPLTRDTVQYALNKVMKNLEIDNIDRYLSPHSFRHTFNSIMLQKGVNPLIIQKICGWSDETIQRTYSHFDDDTLKNVADKMDDIFSDGLSEQALKTLNEIDVVEYKKNEQEKLSKIQKLEKELEATKKQVVKPNFYTDYWRNKYLKLLNDLLDDEYPSTDELIDWLGDAEAKIIR